LLALIILYLCFLIVLSLVFSAEGQEIGWEELLKITYSVLP